MFQFALPRGERRRGYYLNIIKCYAVSIRAPARGATHFILPLAFLSFVSIRAPARGATFKCLRSKFHCWRFNSRSREGSDLRADCLAPPRRSFNSRSREGSDSYAARGRCSSCGFNSRSREGSDKRCDPPPRRAYVSIRAPARGATAKFGGVLSVVTSFNSRSREGSD